MLLLFSSWVVLVCFGIGLSGSGSRLRTFRVPPAQEKSILAPHRSLASWPLWLASLLLGLCFCVSSWFLLVVTWWYISVSTSISFVASKIFSALCWRVGPLPACSFGGFGLDGLSHIPHGFMHSGFHSSGVAQALFFLPYGCCICTRAVFPCCTQQDPPMNPIALAMGVFSWSSCLVLGSSPDDSMRQLKFYYYL